MIEHAAELLPVIAGALCALLAVVAGLVGWLFQRVWAMLGQIFDLLRELEKDLRGDLVQLDRRISAIEGRCNACHRREP